MKDRYTDINEYIRDLQEEIQKDPKCAIHHYNLGVAMLSVGDYGEAENCFLEAIRQSAHLAEAYVQLGGLILLGISLMLLELQFHILAYLLVDLELFRSQFHHLLVADLLRKV